MTNSAMTKSLSLDNATIANALERYAALLDASGSSYYAVRAYRRAADLIRSLPTPVADLVRTGNVRGLRGIGPGLEARAPRARRDGSDRRTRKGRIINHRPENALDLEREFEVAREEGKAVEVNGLPDRLDLRDVHVRLAVEAGVPIVCSTDAHSTRGLGNMQLSVATARRGGATAADVLNTGALANLG
jgi:hypothetical protein